MRWCSPRHSVSIGSPGLTKGHSYHPYDFVTQSPVPCAPRLPDSEGALLRVLPRGFRHTVGTRMINNDVPQRVVQQFLGHETPAMTARYAHIHDSTMKRKLAEYRGKVVDISGKVVEGDGPPISSDALWLKRNILAQALPHGVCRLPIQLCERPHR